MQTQVSSPTNWANIKDDRLHTNVWPGASWHSLVTASSKVAFDLGSSAVGGTVAYLLAAEIGRAPATPDWSNSQLHSDVAYIAFFAIISVSLMASRNLYQTSRRRRFWREIRTVGLSLIAATFVVAGYLSLAPNAHVARSLLLATPAFSCVGAIGWRAAARALVIRGLRGGRAVRRVLIIGEGATATHFHELVMANPEFGYSVRGIVSERRSEIELELDSLVRSEFVDEIVIGGALNEPAICRAVQYAKRKHIDLRILPDALHPALQHAHVEHIGPLQTLAVGQRGIGQGRRLFKRAIDIALSAGVLLLLLPLFVPLAVWIKLDSPGPVFFGSTRIGRKGHVFTCWKLRTMVRDAEAILQRIQHLNERDRILFKISKDPRVTRLGAFLRKFSVDEFPQFFNVLVGDMSLVGPRPPLPGEFAEYELDHLKRFQVSPGITGLWQVKARQNPLFSAYIRYDNFYVDHWSLALDLRIVADTVKIVLKGTGN